MEPIDSVVGASELSDNMAEALMNLQISLSPIKDLVIGWNKSLAAGGFDPELAAHAAMMLHNNLIQMLFVSAVNNAVTKSEEKQGKRGLRRVIRWSNQKS